MKLEIREAEDRDLPQVKRLIDDFISRDFYSIEELENMVHGEDDLLYVVVDADDDDKVVSYFYAFLSTLDDALRILHVPERPEMLKNYAGDMRVGVYKTTTTDPAYRNRGLFSTFMADLQPVLREKGAKMIINTALRPFGREIPILNVLRKTGFIPVEEVHSPWAHTKGYCPYCKKDYCICDAVLFINEFDEEKDGKSNG